MIELSPAARHGPSRWPPARSRLSADSASESSPRGTAKEIWSAASRPTRYRGHRSAAQCALCEKVQHASVDVTKASVRPLSCICVRSELCRSATRCRSASWPVPRTLAARTYFSSMWFKATWLPPRYALLPPLLATSAVNTRSPHVPTGGAPANAVYAARPGYRPLIRLL